MQMSMETKESVKYWTDTAFKAVVVLGPVVAALVVLWLQSEFVSKKDFEKARQEQMERFDKEKAYREKLTEGFLLLTERAKRDDEQDRRISDFEVRLRYIESRRLAGEPYSK